jgi:hypothetical protein
MRKIPKKNYAWLILIVIATVVITFFLTRMYNHRHQQKSVLYEYLSEVTLNDLDTYLLENETAVLYVDDKYNISDNKEEKELKKKIINNNLYNHFVFLDSSMIDQEFIRSFNKKYNYSFKEEYPMIIIIKDKRVVKTYNKLNVSKFNFEDIK